MKVKLKILRLDVERQRHKHRNPKRNRVEKIVLDTNILIALQPELVSMRA